MSNEDPGNIFGYDTLLVKARIENCLKLYMTKQETENAMFWNERIPRLVTHKVWERLEKDNPDFFVAYNTRLMLRNPYRISRFNETLQNSKPESTRLVQRSNTTGGVVNTTTFMPTLGLFSDAVNLQGVTLPDTSSAVSGAEPHREMVMKFTPTSGFSGGTSSATTNPALNVQSAQSDVSSQGSNSEILKMMIMSGPELSGKKRKPGEDFFFPEATMSAPDELSGKNGEPGEDPIFPDEPPNYTDSLDQRDWFGDLPFLPSESMLRQITANEPDIMKPQQDDK